MLLLIIKRNSIAKIAKTLLNKCQQRVANRIKRGDAQVLTPCFCPSDGGVCVLWSPAGPLGSAGFLSVLPEEPSALPPSAAGTGLALPQLHLHAHWVSDSLSHH